MSMWPNSSNLVSSDQSTDFQKASPSSKWSLACFSLAWRCRFFSRGVYLGRQSRSAFLWRTLLTRAPRDINLRICQIFHNHLGSCPLVLLDFSDNFPLQKLGNLSFATSPNFVLDRVSLFDLCNDAFNCCSGHCKTFGDCSVAFSCLVGINNPLS